MNFLSSTLKGILIGAGAILPGISSGVLCVILGIYEALIDSVLGLFQDFKKHATFLFPIVLGGFIGFLLFGNLLHHLFAHYEAECKLLFLGLILGSVPVLFKQVHTQNNFRLSFLFYSLISFGIGLFLFLLEKQISHSYLGNFDSNFIFLFLSGFAMSAGVIIPGISSTVILMCFGTYYLYLEAISMLRFTVLLPMGIGLVCGSIIFLLLIRYFLKHYSCQTYYAIIGFVLGSTFVLLPNHFSLISLFLFAFGFLSAYLFECLFGNVS